MKSGVFPCAPALPKWEIDSEFLLLTQIVAQCMNNHPWTTAVTPYGWKPHVQTAECWGVELTKSNSWWQ